MRQFIASILLLLSIGNQCFSMPVRIRSKVCRSALSCSIFYGNGVVIGNNGQSVLIITNAHQIKKSNPSILINGQWVSGRVHRVSSVIDLATILVYGNYPSLISSCLSSSEPSIGDSLSLMGYDPARNWRQRRSLRRFVDKPSWITGVVIEGDSGSPIYKPNTGCCVGIVEAVERDPRNPKTYFLLSTKILAQLEEWGYPLQDRTESNPVRQEARLVIDDQKISNISNNCNCSKPQSDKLEISDLNLRTKSIQDRLEKIESIIQNQNEVIRQQTVLIQQISTQKGTPGPKGEQGERGYPGPQGIRGEPGVVNIRIIEDNRLVKEYKQVISGSTVELDIKRISKKRGNENGRSN